MGAAPGRLALCGDPGYLDRMMGCLSLSCFLVFGPPGLAFDSGAVAPAASPSVQGYGRSRACRSWTDGCTVCTRRDQTGIAACSTPGIACTPSPISCTAP